MAERLTLKQVAENEGYKDTMDMLVELGGDSVVPACCSEGCQVEPDGRCPHGFPSILIVAGII